MFPIKVQRNNKFYCNILRNPVSVTFSALITYKQEYQNLTRCAYTQLFIYCLLVQEHVYIS